MPEFTQEQYKHALDEHGKLTRFLDAAHTGTADLTLSARADGKGREQPISVTRSACDTLISGAIKRARDLEAKFPIDAWVAPKGSPGKPEKQAEK